MAAKKKRKCRFGKRTMKSVCPPRKHKKKKSKK
jgi:hypothetical protein